MSDSSFSVRGNRAAVLSEDSTTSSSSSLEAALPSSLELKEKLNLETPKEVIKRMLSQTSAISTTSSFAERQNEAAQDQSLQTYRVIGRGACGTIFEHTGLGNALKVATESSSKSLWNDFHVHVGVAKAFGSLNLAIQVPVCKYFVHATDSEWWESNVQKFPERFRTHNHLLCTERILPLPEVIRHGLTELYCPPDRVRQAKQDGANKDCLVRLYLGKRRASEAPSRFFTLRNMILHIDQMEYLGLKTKLYAELMADALAAIHWKAHYDGRDIEFVLGSAPTAVRRPMEEQDFSPDKPARSTWKEATNQTFGKRFIYLWVLDFNQCQSMSMDEVGIDLAVEAFFLNDPYYPRPLGAVSADQQLWKVFQDRYLERSNQIMAGEDSDEVRALPGRFIDRVVETQGERLASRGAREASLEGIAEHEMA